MPSDPINDKPLYTAHNAFGIPELAYTPSLNLPQSLIPYRKRLYTPPLTTQAVHFFLYDALFESVWNSPNKALRYLQKFNTLLTPDFSLNSDLPIAIQLFNVYRNRWCGAHWQALGYQVVPTVSWGDPQSYVFAFMGIPYHAPVALTTLGTRREKHAFLHGFSALLERVQPSLVLCYGKPFPEMERVPLRIYPTHYDTLSAHQRNTDGG